MVRTQITLTEAQLSSLREVASRRRQSVAAVVREAVDQLVAEDAQRGRIRRALQAAQQHDAGSGRTDIARNHDAFLAEDFDA
ncbi:MAG: ribbon-helix-helix protein, CopG family [Egibacteraceae bacterium]